MGGPRECHTKWSQRRRNYIYLESKKKQYTLKKMNLWLLRRRKEGLVTQSSPTLCNPMDCNPPGSSVHGIFPGKKTGVGCHFLLQRICPCKDWTHISCAAGRFVTVWATREAWGGEWVRDFGKVMYTLLYLKWITNKALLYSTWNSAQSYVPA